MTRTPIPKATNSRRGTGGEQQDSGTTAPKAPRTPKVPTIPPVMHQPTSPSPMARSRRSTSQLYHAQSTLLHGTRPLVETDLQRQLLVTAPLHHTKRHLDDGPDDTDEARFKQRRVSGDAGRENADPVATRSRTHSRQVDLTLEEEAAIPGKASVQNQDGDGTIGTQSRLLELEPLSPSRMAENHEADDGRIEDVESDGEDKARVVPDYVKQEMQKFEQGFNGLQGKFKLLNKIGEGTFSSVYKAIDLEYDKYDNSDWDDLNDRSSASAKGSADPGESPKSVAITGAAEGSKVVAIKRIYVTSSPIRIENEVSILRDLSGHKNVVALVTAHRYKDQVILVLPYFEHAEFRSYYRNLPMEDIRCYFRALLSGLAHVHSKKIIHRDIKPSNFLYDPVRKTGILVDFGLAERQEEQSESTIPRMGSTKSSLMARGSLKRPSVASLKHDPANMAHPISNVAAGGALAPARDPSQPSGSTLAARPTRNTRGLGARDPRAVAPQVPSQHVNNASINAPIVSSSQPTVVSSQTPNLTKQEKSKVTQNQTHTMTGREPGYLRRDPRPVARVNRAGTRGFRAPEILFRHVRQTIALDVWSVGAILIAFLTGRFPFFHSYDEADALIEIAILFGQVQMKRAAASFDRTFATNIPTLNNKPLSLTKLCRVLNPQRFGLPVPAGSLRTKSEDRGRNETTVDAGDGAVEVTDEDTTIASQAKHEDENQEEMLEDDADFSQFFAQEPEVGNETMDKEGTGTEKSEPLENNEAKNGLDGENTGDESKRNSTAKKPAVIGWDSQKNLEEAVRLLRRLLALNPEDRITAEETLRHPFLVENQP